MSKRTKVGVLTSSRADYGIYQPLLKLLSANEKFDVHVLAFGMHLLEKFGKTVKEIESDNFGEIHQIHGLLDSDSLLDVGTGYANLVQNFTTFWSQNKFDVVLALGDRFEMSAAVQAAIPFEVLIAHLHGGETTLGATDNIYRHQISLASKIHFVSTKEFKNRVVEILGTNEHVYNVGALSIDALDKLELPSWESVRQDFSIPQGDFVLVTFHPETVQASNNKVFANEVYQALVQISQHKNIVITMTNADAMGNYYREVAFRLKEEFPERISLVESFGKRNYFAAMQACSFLLGNTSSGIVEAASFNKYVINVGNRQKGRLRNANVIDVPFEHKLMIEASNAIKTMPTYSEGNLFSKPNTAKSIMKILDDAKL